MGIYMETSRLILRDWTPDDIGPFAGMNADERVMRYFLKPLNREESEAFFVRIGDEFAARGFGPYAVQVKADGAFAGFVGVNRIPFEAAFTPGVEIAWRLRPEYWGQGFATEAASACLDYARDTLGLHEVWSFTSLPNQASERVMRRIGMVRAGEFDHPLVPPGHPLLRHVLYHKVLVDCINDATPK